MSHFIAQPKQGVPFVSVQAMAKLINSLGIENVLLELTHKLETDFAVGLSLISHLAMQHTHQRV